MGQKGNHGLVKTAPQKFRLFPGEEVRKEHKKFRMPPLYPGEQGPGVVEGYGDPRKLIKGGNQGFYLPVVKTLTFFFAAARGKMIDGTKNTLYFIIILHNIPASCILVYFYRSEKFKIAVFKKV
jgi:hypothetical protein